MRDAEEAKLERSAPPVSFTRYGENAGGAYGKRSRARSCALSLRSTFERIVVNRPSTPLPALHVVTGKEKKAACAVLFIICISWRLASAV